MSNAVLRSTNWIASIAASAAFVLPTVALAGEFWVKEFFQDCEVWSEEPLADGDILTWSGDCVGGQASGNGILIWNRGEQLLTRYDGDMVGGKLEGSGVLVEREGVDQGFDVVSGTFANGEPDGYVTYKSSDGAIFIGNFEKGVMNGHVLWVDSDGNSFTGQFVDGAANGPGRSISSMGEIFEGEFANNERQGSGLLIETNGDVFLGEFAGGLRSGLGRYDGAAGIYEGQFSDDVPNGFGTFTSTDGSVYQGKFVNSDPDGEVLVTLANGDQLIETWNDGGKVK